MWGRYFRCRRGKWGDLETQAKRDRCWRKETQRGKGGEGETERALTAKTEKEKKERKREEGAFVFPPLLSLWL